MVYLLPFLSYLAGSKSVSTREHVQPEYDANYRSISYRSVMRQKWTLLATLGDHFRTIRTADQAIHPLEVKKIGTKRGTEEPSDGEETIYGLVIGHATPLTGQKKVLQEEWRKAWRIIRIQYQKKVQHARYEPEIEYDARQKW